MEQGIIIGRDGYDAVIAGDKETLLSLAEAITQKAKIGQNILMTFKLQEGQGIKICLLNEDPVVDNYIADGT